MIIVIAITCIKYIIIIINYRIIPHLYVFLLYIPNICGTTHRVFPFYNFNEPDVHKSIMQQSHNSNHIIYIIDYTRRAD